LSKQDGRRKVKRHMKKLKSLDQFNAERKGWLKKMLELNDPHPNGIACPVCGKEMFDIEPTIMLTSDPPKKKIKCPWCGYIGYRLA